jgi:hypothetical protein
VVQVGQFAKFYHEWICRKQRGIKLLLRE